MEFFELEKFDIEETASENYVIITRTLFFSPINPFIFLIGLSQIVFTFYLNKWIFAHRSQTPDNISFLYCRKLIRLFESSFVIWGLAFMLFDYDIN